jgi:hypothetical protein
MNWDYVAGFFDAGGCVGFYTTTKEYHYSYATIPKGRKLRMIIMTQKTRQVLQDIHCFLKKEGIESQIDERKNIVNGRVFPYYRLEVRGRASKIKFLEEIKDKVILKRSKVIDALEDLQSAEN